MGPQKQLRAVFFRELAAYFNSTIAYIFIIVFMMMTAGLFMTNFFLLGQADMRYFFDTLPLVLCVFVPALTMRLWAEDKKGNTFELLLTFPLSSWKLVVGKSLAAFVFYLLALAGTLLIPFMLHVLGHPDPGPILGGYLGAIFLGAFFIAVGAFISALCVDQIVAFIVAMMACFLFFMVGWETVTSMMDGWLPGFGSLVANALGAGRHFAGFTKGVIDLRDIFYFMCGSSIFVVLNVLAVEDRLRRGAKLYFMLTAIVGGLVIACVNVLLSDMPLGRYDLTAGRVYTITESAENILARLDAPVTLKLYITPQEKMPTALKTLEQDIRDRLEELRVRSKGKLLLRVIRMEVEQATNKTDDDSLAAKLQKKGIAPIPVRSIDKDEVGVKLVYASLALSYKDRDEEYIPRVLPDSLSKLEYSVAAKIYRMMLDKKPMVVLVAPYQEKKVEQNILDMFKRMGQALPANMREDNFRMLEAALKYEDYNVKRIRLNEDEPIPEGADALIVVASDKLIPRQRYEIDRYLYAGGDVVLATQGYTFDYKQNQYGTGVFPKKLDTQVNELLSGYGVKLSDGMLMDENQEIINVSGNAENAMVSFTSPVKVPIQVMVPSEQIDQKLSFTNSVSSIFYLWGSALQVDEARLKMLGLKKNVLFKSGPLSWIVPQRSQMLTKDDISSVGKDLKGNYPLAVLLEGQFPLVFEGKSAPDWKEEYTPPPSGEEIPDDMSPAEAFKASVASLPIVENVPTAKPGKLLVVGCYKMFEDQLLRENGSLDLFTNVIDAFTLGGELIKVRSHQPVVKRIKTISGTEKLWYRFLTVFLVPVLLVIFGLVRALWRRKEKAMYLKLLKKDKP